MLRRTSRRDESFAFRAVGAPLSSSAKGKVDHFAAVERRLVPSSQRADSPAPSSSSSSVEGEQDGEDEEGEVAGPSSSSASSSASESFRLGDAVYTKSNIAHPNLGILTDIWRPEQDDEDEDEEEDENSDETILCRVRFLYWPQDVSQVTAKKLGGLIEKDEVYYTHTAPRRPGRKTKNSLRYGQDIDDGFERGPSLLEMTINVESILGKASVWASREACEEAQKAKAPAERQLTFKRKKWSTDVFVKRAIDPIREVFWNVDWKAVEWRGRQCGKWDLAEGDDGSRVRKAVGNSDTFSPLETPGKNANEWALILTREFGIRRVDSTEPKRRKRDPVMDTPSKRRGSTKTKLKAGKQTRRSLSPASDSDSESSLSELDDDDGGQDAFTLDLSDHESDSDDSTAITSEEEDGETDDGGEFEDGDSDEDGGDYTSTKRKRARAPTTPRKRRVVLADSSPVKAYATPRSRARILGLKRATASAVSLPAQAPKMTSLSLDELRSMSAQDRAKRLLHVGATPEALPCREEQYDEVLACVEDAVEEGIGGCLYVSGVPGTGKTATVREVIRSLQGRAERDECNPFTFVEINGMKLPDAEAAYSLLWSALSGGERVGPKTALKQLSAHFGSGASSSLAKGGRRKGANGSAFESGAGGPARAATVVLMDELDQLVTTRQDVMYNMFNWPNTPGSRLIVVAVANTMDLPERVLNPKVASRLGMTRITFMPYTDRQLVEIVESRLGFQFDQEQSDATGENDRAKLVVRGCKDVFTRDALTYVSKRVSNVSGDARRMLDVCRRSVELVQQQGPADCSVSIGDVRKVLDAMVKTGKVSHIVSLSLHAKILLRSLLSCVRKTGLTEAAWGDVAAHHNILCRMQAIHGTHSGSASQNNGFSVQDLARPLASLCGLGLVVCVGGGLNPGKLGIHSKLLLACQEDEIRLALEQDKDDRIRRML